MKKLLFDANFNDDILSEQIQLNLFSACKNTAPEYVFDGFSKYTLTEKFPDNVINYNIKAISQNFWQNIVPPIVSMRNKNIPFYFPIGNIPNFISSQTPVITMIKDLLPVDYKKYTYANEEINNFKRRIQTDINRSDLIFVPNEIIKKRLMSEFLFIDEPVVLNFASLISDEYLKLQSDNNREKYFLVDLNNIIPKYLDELLKIFIYSHMTGNNDTKLYFINELQYATQSVMVNMQVARKVGAVKEFPSLSIKEKTILLKNAIAAIFFSNEEVLPISHLDAMRCSCPVITNITPAIKEICADSVIYLDIENVSDLNSILNRIADDNIVRENFAQKGYAKANEFSWNNSAQIFIENIEKLFV